ncbi:DUF2177 family protein [Bradyrhizobium sp.]|uniref:DUF2177 family protein n=1 Tax=Bradyrhizobium sp. TaxID=376 RepID=UPI001ED73CAF|nr:DUF2177 family protein [Bradyrhizobium sp.]MBV8919107.1 DUF2177 family protein [Bradyrhizobium sp.]MBV9981714.1 DUF2177 family protein [Bradyrhizobium sp.]
MRLFLSYLAVAVSFVAIDMVWLSLMAERLYRPVLGDILKPKPELAPAAVFYLVYTVGLFGFVVWPAQQNGSPLRVLLLGALFGFVTYATYDLTNQATLRNWSTALSIADICWGSVLAAISALIGYMVGQRLGAGA